MTSRPVARESLGEVLVSLDLETTGLLPEQDEIIEVGAIKFRGLQVLDTFQCLVNPLRPIPPGIQLLTGITQQEADKATPFSEVADDLAVFLGSLPIVGHNIKFDLDFLKAKGLRPVGPAYDTQELAQIMFPRLPSYALRSVAGILGVEQKTAHRALADARTALEVFHLLVQHAAQFDVALLDALLQLQERAEQPLRGLFRQLVEAKGGTPASVLLRGSDDLVTAVHGSRLFKGAKPWPALVPNLAKQLVETDEIEHLLKPGGPLAEALVSYEDRPQQRAMARAVTQALNQGQHLLVEAGTGVGKSLAYLLPAVLFSTRNSMRVVVSTYTKNLQEQLMEKDIPVLLQAVRASRPETRDAASWQLKGKGNYLCLKRWASHSKAQHLSAEEARLLCRTLVWLGGTESGDAAELNFNNSDAKLWDKLSAQNVGNPAKECPYFRQGQCFLRWHRGQAEGAHILVVNHALLLADLAQGGGLLPPYDHLIIDEGHHLEEVATQQLGFEVGPRDLEEFCLAIGQDLRSGLAAEVMARIVREQLSGEVVKGIEDEGEALVAASVRARRAAHELFQALGIFALRSSQDSGEYERQVRFTRLVRTDPGWGQVERPYENLHLLLKEMGASLARLRQKVERLDARQVRDLDGLLLELSATTQRMEELLGNLDTALRHPSRDFVYWCTVSPQTGVAVLKGAPVHVGSLLQKALFEKKETVVITSATLSTGGHFRYMKERLSLENPQELLLGTPFDYKGGVLLFLPSDVPPPDAAGYQHAVQEALVSIARAAQGRTLALFTSHAALRGVYPQVQEALAEAGILVLGQGIDGAPQQVLGQFRSDPKAVLLGTSSFWEGVDLPGDALRVLVVTRLPFSVPTDPVYAARAEAFDDPFNGYGVPQAVLRFKQGFGRLMRRKSDRGVVVVLDRRIQTKAYGPEFLNSLPPCTTRSGPLRSLPQEIARWLGRDTERAR